MAFRAATRWYGKLFNERVRRRLSSDKHGSLSKNHLLISMIGRKSGRQITLPVNYRRVAADKLVIGTESIWWLNLKDGASVEVELAGKTLSANAMPVPEDAPDREAYGRLLCGPTWPVFRKSLVIIELALAGDSAPPQR